LLLNAGWLGHCDPSLAEAILKCCRIRVLDAGEVLFHHGDPSHGLFGTLSGSFALSIVVPEFGPSVSHIFMPGTWFGESALVRGTRTVGVHATRPTRAMFLANRDIEALVAEDPRRWTSFARLTFLNTQIAIGSGYDLMLREPLKRCAATLLRLAGLRHSPPLIPVPLELDISQADLAHMTNMSRNSVGAILRILRERNCVEVDYRQLVITDPAVLKAILDPDS
jgi:CRP-like cAMP-binding protein